MYVNFWNAVLEIKASKTCCIFARECNIFAGKNITNCSFSRIEMDQNLNESTRGMDVVRWINRTRKMKIWQHNYNTLMNRWQDISVPTCTNNDITIYDDLIVGNRVYRNTDQCCRFVRGFESSVTNCLKTTYYLCTYSGLLTHQTLTLTA
jgi:hypothetical protein